jgi:hypothetical protein
MSNFAVWTYGYRDSLKAIKFEYQIAGLYFTRGNED